jgi:hypothetical protein
MQHTFDKKMASKITARNTPENIRFRMTVRFSLLYLALFTVGLLAQRLLPLTRLSVWKSFFDEALSSPLRGGIPARDEIRAMLFSVRREMLLLVLLLFAGMTMLSERICGAVLSLHAFLFGTLCCSIADTYLSAPAFSAKAVLPICVLAQFANAVILLTAAGEAVIFSYRYRDIGRGPRKMRDSLTVYYILHALTVIGTMTAIGVIRALVLHALQNL